MSLTLKAVPERMAIVGTPNPTCIMDSNVGLKFLVLNINFDVGNISFSVGNTGDMLVVVFMKMCSISLLCNLLHCNLTTLLTSLWYSAAEIILQTKCR